MELFVHMAKMKPAMTLRRSRMRKGRAAESPLRYWLRR